MTSRWGATRGRWLAGRPGALAALGGALVAAVLGASIPVPTAAAELPAADRAALTTSADASFIVVPEVGRFDAAMAAVVALAGDLVAPLGAVEGFVIDLPAHAVTELEASDAVRSVVPNTGINLSGGESSGTGFPIAELRKGGVDKFEKKGFHGQGVDVALIDSGVATVPGLDGPGKVLHGVDLSNEAGFENLAHRDTYGHGTHMAGIIAGDDGPEGEFHGMATGARIVSVKVANAVGETNVAQIIAGIDWVIEHRNRDGLNIRVLNLSLGLDDVATNLDDPLSAAVERAWDAGIVVVAAAGNRGNGTDGVDSPAVSPYVIAVGASAQRNSNPKEDEVSPFTSAGNGLRDPDVLVPGKSLLSLRVPGSFIDETNPQAREGRFLKGSGTSQSAAMFSGWAALAISAEPSLTPDQVKFLFLRSARDIIKRDTRLDGVGRPRLNKVLKLLKVKGKAPNQNHPRALGGGSSAGVASPTGATWSGGGWNGATWSGGTWSGATWSGATWSGATWSGATWSGATWSGATWSGAAWSGATWSGAAWSGATWSGATWSGATWSGSTWSNAFWE